MLRAGLVVVLCFSGPALAGRLEGRVLQVFDGDTVLFRADRQRPFSLRLAGIDAPESGQPHGAAATRALGALTEGRRVSVELVAVDRYQRRVGTLAADGRDLSAELVRRGDAWATRYYADRVLLGLETRARSAGRGLWAQPDPIPPWRWRKAQKHISE